MSFWLKPRQIVIMDAQSSGPARNFSARYITLFLISLLVIIGVFLFGAWYAPFYNFQKIIPENIKLKRQTLEMQRELADMKTVNDLKDEQLNSLKEQLGLQETEIVNVSKQLHMYKSILDERKGTGIHILESNAQFSDNKIAWSSLFVKGGSYPRYLKGKYELFALGNQGNRVSLTKEKLRYKIESHIFLRRTFDWQQAWQPTKLELVIYNSRLKEVLRKIILIEGK